MVTLIPLEKSLLMNIRQQQESCINTNRQYTYEKAELF